MRKYILCIMCCICLLTSCTGETLVKKEEIENIYIEIINEEDNKIHKIEIKEKDVEKIIDMQHSDRYDFEFGLVSFENECIYSIYDDRGCDVVFFTHGKMKEFYNKLKSYFLDNDIEEMERRYIEIRGE